MSRRRVLVTGGAGYLGSILCEHLLDAGHEVLALDSLVHGVPSLAHLCANRRFDFRRGDVRDAAEVERCLRDVDVIIPLAGIVGAPACDRDPTLAVQVNLEAVRTINRLRSKDQLVLFPNTNSGYGTRSMDVHCDESTPLEPISLYGRTKVDAECELLSSPNAVTFRLATLFGMSPRPRFDLMVNHFVRAALRDRYLVLFEKDFRRNFLHVRDAADCFLHAIEHASAMVGRAFNAGLDSANLSKAQLAEKIKEHVPGFYVHYAPIGTDPDKRDYIVSNQRLREAGFEARRSLDEGIRELIVGYSLLSAGSFRNA